MCRARAWTCGGNRKILPSLCGGSSGTRLGGGALFVFEMQTSKMPARDSSPTHFDYLLRRVLKVVLDSLQLSDAGLN